MLSFTKLRELIGHSLKDRSRVEWRLESPEADQGDVVGRSLIRVTVLEK
jgi:hypothetical protein